METNIKCQCGGTMRWDGTSQKMFGTNVYRHVCPNCGTTALLADIAEAVNPEHTLELIMQHKNPANPFTGESTVHLYSAMQYDDYPCKNCINNPMNNPAASGVCNCILPSQWAIRH